VPASLLPARLLPSRMCCMCLASGAGVCSCLCLLLYLGALKILLLSHCFLPLVSCRAVTGAVKHRLHHSSRHACTSNSESARHSSCSLTHRGSNESASVNGAHLWPTGPCLTPCCCPAPLTVLYTTPKSLGMCAIHAVQAHSAAGPAKACDPATPAAGVQELEACSINKSDAVTQL
jgi:hypothetical protein